MEPADLWQRYLEPQYRDRAIRIELRDGVEHLIIGEVSVLSSVLARARRRPPAAREGVRRPGSTYADGCEPASYDPRRRAALLDDWGVDRGVLFPTIGILPFPTDDAPLANAYCRAYNRWQTRVLRGRAGPRGADRAGQLARCRRGGQANWKPA